MEHENIQLNPDQEVEVVITLDIAKRMTVKELQNIYSEALFTGKPIQFDQLNEDLSLSKRSFYIRTKSMPVPSGQMDIIKTPGKIEIGC